MIGSQARLHRVGWKPEQQWRLNLRDLSKNTMVTLVPTGAINAWTEEAGCLLFCNNGSNSLDSLIKCFTFWNLLRIAKKVLQSSRKRRIYAPEAAQPSTPASLSYLSQDFGRRPLWYPMKSHHAFFASQFLVLRLMGVLGP